MAISWSKSYFLLSLTSVKRASCLMRICCFRESVAQRESANSSSAVMLDDAGCLQESVAPGTLPSQGQHPRAVDTLRTPTYKRFPRALRGERFGRIDRLWLRERMSCFGPVSAGRSPVFVRPTTGAVSRHSCVAYAAVAFEVLACSYPSYGKWRFVHCCIVVVTLGCATAA